MEAFFGALPILLILLFIFSRNLANQQRHAELVKKFSKIQKKRKSRVIAIVHRQEPMGLLGIPMLRYIDLNDAEDVLEAIRKTPPNKPLEFILHTPGGLVLPAVQIARAIKAHPGKKTVFVPHYAMSGGTLIALAADEVVLSDHAVLGPIDPQIGGLPAASVVRVAGEKPIQNTDDYTLVLADVGAMAITQLQKIARELLTGTVSENAAISISEQLSSGRWTHDYPIAYGEAKELGLNVSREMPKDIMELMSLFPDSLRRTKSVRYLEEESVEHHAAADHRVTLTGYQPQPGSRSFSYGPWNPKELKGRAKPHEEKRKPFWRRSED
ncbi:SDH family Clp fold serine proteinase [Hyphococcus sp.]|uniref:SDH family Clp fold serine proteinase n=1 Tax=Hyphococcus sp. TaxID=2038636 RepID=UPI0035C6F75F